MTKEEAIKRIRQDLDVNGKYLSKEYKEALNMAIELLSNDTTKKPNDAVEQKNDVVAEPTDLISRADALEQIAQAECGLHYEDCEADNCACSYIGRILNIPSAELTLQTPQTYGKSINQSNAEVVADLISRADAIEELGEYFDHLKRIDKRGIKRIEPISLDCKGIINKLPSADRPSGKWINEWKDIDGGRMYGACCSVCHTIGHTGYNYCPNCGAKMGSGFQ